MQATVPDSTESRRDKGTREGHDRRHLDREEFVVAVRLLLDVREHVLVCVPADVFVNVGAREGVVARFAIVRRERVRTPGA